MKWLRQPPGAVACAGNVCTGGREAEKRHLEEEEGKGGRSSETKSPSRLPSSWRKRTGEIAPNELIPTRLKEARVRAPRGRRARPPRPAPQSPCPVGTEPLAAAELPLPAAPHRRQAGLAPSPRPDTIAPRPSRLAPSPLPSGGWRVRSGCLSARLPEPRQPFQCAPGKPWHKITTALQPAPPPSPEEQE